LFALSAPGMSHGGADQALAATIEHYKFNNLES